MSDNKRKEILKTIGSWLFYLALLGYTLLEILSGTLY